MAIYKHGQGFKLQTTENKSSKLLGRNSNPELLDCKSDVLITLPCCLRITSNKYKSLLVVTFHKDSKNSHPIAMNIYSYNLLFKKHLSFAATH